jgi:hypothetical protein
MRSAIALTEDPDAQVQLVGSRIGSVASINGQQRVWRCLLAAQIMITLMPGSRFQILANKLGSCSLVCILWLVGETSHPHEESDMSIRKTCYAGSLCGFFFHFSRDNECF